MAPTVGAHGGRTGLIGRAVVSRLSEVTNLPLLKIFAYIGRVEFVLPPTVHKLLLIHSFTAVIFLK